MTPERAAIYFPSKTIPPSFIRHCATDLVSAAVVLGSVLSIWSFFCVVVPAFLR